MRRILYISNVDWNWIKQRPQFIAEELSKHNNVLIIYQYRYGRKGYQKRDTDGINIRKMFVIPTFDRFRFGNVLNTFLRKIYVRYFCNRFKPDVIYTTFPNQIHTIPNKFSGRVIYDCMDDHYAIAGDPSKKSNLRKDEEMLCLKSKDILCSSLHLRSVLTERYGKRISSKITLVRNAYGDKIIPIDGVTEHGDSRQLDICYIGTVGSWFDFDLLLESIRQNKNIFYYIYGPIDGGVIPKSSNIIYKGTIEHSELYLETKKYDCYIMPFKLNDIVLSVDPVKIYEYINFGKNIICIKYEEVERFSDFVYLYKDVESYMAIIEKLLGNNSLKYSNEQREQLLSKNGWKDRVDLIMSLMEEISLDV